LHFTFASAREDSRDIIVTPVTRTLWWNRAWRSRVCARARARAPFCAFSPCTSCRDSVSDQFTSPAPSDSRVPRLIRSALLILDNYETLLFIVRGVQLKLAREVSIFTTAPAAVSRRRWPVMQEPAGDDDACADGLSRDVSSINSDRHHATPVDARRSSIASWCTWQFFPYRPRVIDRWYHTSGDIIQVASSGWLRPTLDPNDVVECPLNVKASRLSCLFQHAPPAHSRVTGYYRASY
jgi:hypothetical protein